MGKTSSHATDRAKHIIDNLDCGVYKSLIASAWVMELVDIRDLKSLGAMLRAGSTPAPGTSNLKLCSAPVSFPKVSLRLWGYTDKFTVKLSVLRPLSPTIFPLPYPKELHLFA